MSAADLFPSLCLTTCVQQVVTESLCNCHEGMVWIDPSLPGVITEELQQTHASRSFYAGKKIHVHSLDTYL